MTHFVGLNVLLPCHRRTENSHQSARRRDRKMRVQDRRISAKVAHDTGRHQLVTAICPPGPLFCQAFLNKAFLMRPTATVTIAPVMPPLAALPSAVPMSTPPLAAPPRAGIKLCRIVPPIPPPTAPDIVLRRGLRTIFLKRPPMAFPPTAPPTI